MAVLGSVGAGVVLPYVANHTGLADEYEGRAYPVDPLEQQAQWVHWVDMPASPFLEVAHRPNGTYSLDHLIGAYKAAGLSAEQAKDVAHQLPSLSPVLMGANDPVLVAQLQSEARATARSLATHYPQAQARLEDMIARKAVPSSKRERRWEAPGNWSAVRVEWVNPSPLPTDTLDMEPLALMEMPEATQTLEIVMKATGLRALRITPGTWDKPQSIYDLAMGLNQANEDLIDATGWKDQVLGLGGRVVLTMGSPPLETRAAGLTQASSNGRLEIIAEWSNLSHEWIHAVDYVAATKALEASPLRTLSEQLRPIRFTADAGVFDAWKQASQGLADASPDWQRARAARSQEMEGQLHAGSTRADTLTSNVFDEASYWRANSEKFAYAFQAFVASGRPLVLRASHEDIPAYRQPSGREVAAQATVWPRLFAAMDHLQLSKPMPMAHLTSSTSFASNVQHRRDIPVLAPTDAIIPVSLRQKSP